MNSTPRPLPVSATFVRAYHLVWFNRRLLLRATAIPFLMLTMAFGLFMRQFATATTQEDVQKVMASTPNSLILCMALAELFGVWTLCAVNVSWRRYLLRLNDTIDPLYFRRPLWRYVFSLFVGSLLFLASFFVVLGLLGGVVGHVAPMAGNPASSAGRLATALGVVVMLGLMGVLIRHVLIFTQVVTDEPDARFTPLRRAMHGNVLRMVLIWMLTVCTAVGIPQIVQYILQMLHVPLDNPLMIVFTAGLNSFVLIVLVALLSAVSALVYDYLVRGGGPAGMN